ncbi:hypothetical protein U9M48_018575 [Paspalum notatum var. saurae]|uniref:Uncharacterized protein n=1 Tax=Paspalum notatum var. saurae TaxID=547442 RepID=A0AAQ3WPX0_PASNO
MFETSSIQIILPDRDVSRHGKTPTGLYWNPDWRSGGAQGTTQSPPHPVQEGQPAGEELRDTAPAALVLLTPISTIHFLPHPYPLILCRKGSRLDLIILCPSATSLSLTNSVKTTKAVNMQNLSRSILGLHHRVNFVPRCLWPRGLLHKNASRMDCFYSKGPTRKR